MPVIAGSFRPREFPLDRLAQVFSRIVRGRSASVAPERKNP